MKLLRIFIITGFIFIILGGFVFFVDPSNDTTNSKIIAPNFSIQTIDDETISLSSFKGKMVIVDFMATWCNPCLTQGEYFLNLLQKYDSFVIISLSLEPADSQEHLLDWTKGWGTYGHAGWYWVAFEAGTEAIGIELFNLTGFLPSMVVIDSQGFIRQNLFGLVSEPQLEEWIQLYNID